MTDYMTEQEQIEILKNWIKQYALVILLGVVVAIVGITGWRYWQDRQMKILNHASSVYDEMIMVRSQNDPAATLIQAKKILKHYPKTVYGQLAALMLSRDAANKKHYEEAMSQLQWVIDMSSIAPLKQIARLRYARILLAQNKPDAALKMVSEIDDKVFSGLADEIKGDAYLAKKNIPLAREAYQNALTELPNAEILRPILQMKYDNLAMQKN